MEHQFNKIFQERSNNEFTEHEEEKYQRVVNAVKKGNNEAKTILAWYKLSGIGGCEVDEDGAVILLEERVKDNDFEAMWILGLCYEFGMGCEQDLTKADSLANAVNLFYNDGRAVPWFNTILFPLHKKASTFFGVKHAHVRVTS